MQDSSQYRFSQHAKPDMPNSLKELLLLPHYDVDDFMSVIQHFYSASQGSREETRMGEQDNSALIVKWGKKGAIAAIEKGPAFQESDLPAIEAALVSALGSDRAEIRRFIVMTRRPVLGAIGFKDWFQLIPAPDAAPRPAFPATGGNPAVLEVMIRASDNMSIDTRRAHRAVSEIEALFAAITKEGVARVTSGGRPQWAFLPDSTTQPMNVQPGYHLSNFEHRADNFTCIKMLADVDLDVADAYYRSGIDPSIGLCLPETFPALALCFRNLPTNLKRRFRRAGYWMKVASETMHISKSVAYAATVRAIETVMPLIVPGEPCGSCGIRPGTQTRQAFAQFVDRLTGQSIEQNKRLAFYDRRSRLVHGDVIFTWDEEQMSEQSIVLDEMSDTYAILDIAQTVLHNWLCERSETRLVDGELVTK